jgi:hypothetical protein
VLGKVLSSLFQKYLIFPAPFVEMTMISLLNCLDPCVKIWLAIKMWVYFWILCFMSMLYLHACPYKDATLSSLSQFHNKIWNQWWTEKEKNLRIHKKPIQKQTGESICFNSSQVLLVSTDLCYLIHGRVELSLSFSKLLQYVIGLLILGIKTGLSKTQSILDWSLSIRFHSTKVIQKGDTFSIWHSILKLY